MGPTSPASDQPVVYISIPKPYHWVREMWSIGFAAGLDMNTVPCVWVCLNWRLGMSIRASEWQKGEAEPREQKQGLWHRSWEMQLSCRTGAQGKSHALGRKGTEVATKLHLWTWCELGSQAWAGAVATWLGWGITVSGLASLCVRESCQWKSILTLASWMTLSVEN